IAIILSIFLLCLLNSFAQTAPKETPSPSGSPAGSSTVIEFEKNPDNSATPLSSGKEPLSVSAKPNVESPSSRYVRKDAPVRIPRLETPPVIDGKLDDPVWQTAALFGEFLQTSPGDNIAPTHPTEFMMGYDSKHLYLAFRIIQDRDKVRATVARRDNIFNDDYVLVHLDTFNDQRQAYLLFFNPLGIQADGTYTEGRGEDYSLDIVMESKGVLTEDGFTIEVAIPFKSLRYEAGKNKQWGLHINRRVKYNNNEYNSWMPTNRRIAGWLNQAGKITGLEGIETTRQLEINPSLTLSQAGRRSRYTFDGNPAGRFVNEGLEADFGFTAKFGLTPTMTLDFAYNPDFAQVEADAPVSTANVRFPINFPEKRPFFLERIDIFQTRMNVVNTRAIADPDVAAKLTGRRGKNTFGIMYASDNAPGNYSPDERECLLLRQNGRLTNPNVPCANERYVDKNADIGVLRIKRDIGRQHNLGMFATTFNFPDRHNHTAGFDGRFRLNPKTIFDFQLLGTHSRRFFYDPDIDRSIHRTGNGFGYSYIVTRSDKNLYMELGSTGRTRDYRADVGFTPRLDTNQHRTFVQYQTDRDAKKSIIYKRINNSVVLTHDWKGRTQNYSTNTQGMLALQRQVFIGAGTVFGYERVFEDEPGFGARRSATQRGTFFGPDPERSAHNREIYGFIEAAPTKQLFALLVLGHEWGQLDYDFGAGRKFPRVSAPYLAWRERCAADPACTEPPPALDPGAGNQLFIESMIRYQPTAAWQAQINYNRTRLVRNDTGRVAFDDNVFSFRSTYQFTRDTFARMRLDYSNVSARVRPQLIFGWTPSPGTALYAGYNDDLNYNSFNPYTGLREPGFRGNGRTFFIKASYLFKKSF
ncbi:MAG TPA: carbohydrate binding family 9 domain-containing protein, partial [Pyrinomonadaceae bacterium]|nr:carbohydrate binding family 9 domain-containing protein [Pyrinomonadaceae bacterium]